MGAERKPVRADQPPDLSSLYHSIIEHAPHPMAIVENHLVRHVNPAFCRLLGKNSEELTGKSFAEIMPECHGCLDLLDKVFRTGKAESHTEQGRSEPHPVFWSYAMWPVRISGKPPAGVMVQITETTQFHEQSVAMSQALLVRAVQQHELKDSILKSALDAIITMDHEGKFVEFNPAAEEIFGYSRAEVIGKPLAELIIPARLREQHYQGLAQCLATGQGPVLNRLIELPALRADGTEFPAELAIVPITDSQPPMFTAFLRDITERKKARQALAESEQRFRQVADTMPQIVWSARPDGYIDYYNERWYEFTGFPRGEFGQSSWEGILHPDDVQRTIDHYFSCIREGKPYQIEYRFKESATGGYRWFMGRALPVKNEQGEIVRWFGTCTDIDDQKRAEEKLEMTVAERTAKLQETINELEAFSYSVSHDLRAPLRAMQGYAKALLDDYKSGLDSEGLKYLETIFRASKRLDLLIQDVLAYSRVALGQIELHPVDLERLIADILPNYPEFQSPQARIVVESPLHRVLGHEAYLTQCVTNLLGNAVKFVPAEAIPEIRIRSERLDGKVRVWFEDNGIGIDRSHYDRIFQIFGKVHPEKQYPGTGIGLAIVRKAVQRMGGELGVESKPGQGSRFWIILNEAIHDN